MRVFSSIPIKYRVVRLWITLLLIAGAASMAQAQREVSGTIQSEEGIPLPGVNVLVKGTVSGTISDAQGFYSIEVPSSASVITFSFIGYATLEKEVGNQSELNVTMKPDVQELSELVITSFGLEREKKALGYAVQAVEGEEVAKVPTPSVVNNLSGRVAGLQVATNSVPGGAPEFVLRGFSSVAGNNQPLIVVDGVPIQQTSNATTDDRVDNQRYGGGISEIDPNNIADVSVLKGPNAAALYGSRAANGVIIITTKRGKSRQGIGVDVNLSTTFDRPLVKPDFQNIYGGGSGYRTWYADGWSGTVDGIKGTAGTDESWGQPMDGTPVRQWFSGTETVPLVPNPDNWEEFWETGQTLNGSVAISGGNEKGNFRLSIGRQEQEGIMYNNDFYRNNFRLNTSYNFTDKLSLTVLGEYVKSGSDNRGYLRSSDFIWHHRHVDFNQLRNYQNYEDVHIQPPGNDEPPNWQHTYFTNSFFRQDVLTTSNEKDRLLGNISLNYAFNDWMSLMLRSGTDVWTDTRIDIDRYERVRFSSRPGRYSEEVLRRQETNSDFILSIDKDVIPDLNISAQLGGVNRVNYFKRNYSRVNQLTIDRLYNLGNNASPNTDESAIIESQVNSLFGAVQFGYRNFLFLDVTGRNDWSSTLPEENNSFFYPSVSLSSVITDLIPDLNTSFLSFAKLRVSWAEVGNDADPYQLQQVYTPEGLYDGAVPKFAENNEIANASLRPEITTGIELGADLRFLNGKIYLDVTYYDQTTEDQILAVDISRASGYTSRILNAGKITNRGIEASLQATLLETTSGLTWDAGINFARNRNEVVELADGLTAFTLWNIRGASLEARVGEAYGNIYGNRFARSPEGAIIYDDNGLPYNDEGQHVIGNITPDWTGGAFTSVSFRGLTISALIDVKKGGDVYDMGSSIARRTGVLQETSVGREEGVIGQGVRNVGTEENPVYVENDVVVESDNVATFYGRYVGRQFHEAAVMDGSYVKLREASVSYELPEPWFDDFFLQSASFSVIGRNLAILHKNTTHIDPEISSAFLGYNYGQLPSTRSVGFSLNVKF